MGTRRSSKFRGRQCGSLGRPRERLRHRAVRLIGRAGALDGTFRHALIAGAQGLRQFGKTRGGDPEGDGDNLGVRDEDDVPPKERGDVGERGSEGDGLLLAR